MSPFVKVCGLSTARDVQLAVAHQADAIGFVLTASPRQIDPEQAAALAALVPESIATVAVFKNEDVPSIIARATLADVDWVQVHGQRSETEIRELAAAGFEVIRAIRRDAPDEQFACWGEKFLLVDAAMPGSGEAWDYAAVRERAAARRWLLAGGLHAGNVASALADSQATGADVSSGLESSRGVKDPEKITAFLAAAKGA